MRAHHLLFAFVIVLLLSCKKETEQYQSEPLTNYLSLQPGKYITYRTDSTLFTNFGTVTVVRSYQEKNQVDALTTDNLGRPSYRVFRFIRDVAGTQAWQPNGSFFITINSNTVEVIENNLRFVKLAAPLKQDYSWKGNEFLPTKPYQDNYSFSNDNAMGSWNYTYTGVDESLSLNNQTLNNVITVQHVNESANAPVTQSQTYGYINFSVDKFAKGIGLVYQEFDIWEYQPVGLRPAAYYTGFAVKRSMIDHN